MYVHVTAWLWTWRLTFFLLSLIFLAWFSFIDLYIKFSAEKLSFAPSWLYLRLLAECPQHVLLFFLFFFFLKCVKTRHVCWQKKQLNKEKVYWDSCRIYDKLICATAFIFISLLLQQFRTKNGLSYSIHKQEIPNKLDVG